MASSEISRVRERSKCRKRLNEIYDEAINAYLIHYSCESFYAPDGQSPLANSTRVTSIAVRNLKSGQTKTWSIHKSAELCGLLDNLTALIKANAPLASQPEDLGAAQAASTAQISEILNPLEFDMLKGYFSFVENHTDSTFVHWNMRDDNYGFSALEHRFRVLKGVPVILQDNKKFDLARELITIYGKRYASHTSPSGRRGRLMTVIELNKISDTDALQGAEEAAAFVNGEFIKLQQSTLRKVDVLSNVFDRTHDKSLKTSASFMDTYGVHPVALLEVAKNNPVVTGLIFLGGALAAIVRYKNSILSIASWF
ncbi:MAG TPA: hypothetical protein VNU71_06645 [Burkholderiaceae bacterium]|nr:hypothetical protein [Burkholderiaceae bacterium]